MISNKRITMLKEMKRILSDKGLSNPNEAKKTLIKADTKVTIAKLIPMENKTVFVKSSFFFNNPRVSNPGMIVR
jgi:hypothetical protein